MTNQEGWLEFLNNMLTNFIQAKKETQEGELLSQRKKHINDMLDSVLMEDQKVFVDNVMFELGLAADRELEDVYQQGMRDTVWILKNLGVI